MTTSETCMPAREWVEEAARIRVAEPGRLRDYFLRLGANAEVVGSDVAVTLTAEREHESTIEDYLRSWVDVNACPATIDRQPATSSPAPPADAFRADRPRLGDLLIAWGLLAPDQLASGLVESRATQELLGSALIRMGYIFEDELARSLATQLEIPYVNLRSTGVDRRLARLMPASEGMRVCAIPIGYFGGRLRAAFADPSDPDALGVVERYVGPFETVVAQLSDIRSAWRGVEERPATLAAGLA